MERERERGRAVRERGEREVGGLRWDAMGYDKGWKDEG